jgi:hypothetical protein
MGVRSKPSEEMDQRLDALLDCGYLRPLPLWARMAQLDRLRRSAGKRGTTVARIGQLSRVVDPGQEEPICPH